MPPPRFVWLQSPPWDGIWTRQNHFSRRFAAQGASVLYVENPASFKVRMSGGVGAIGASLRRDVEEGLHVMSLPLQIPGSRTSSLIGALNAGRFAGAIGSWLDREGWCRPIYWCRLPVAVELLRRLPPGPVVYDVTDHYASYAQSKSERLLTAAREERLAAQATQIFTTTPELAERLGQINPHTIVVPNGVDPSFFDVPPADAVDPLPHVPRPRIGHIGLTAHWTDLELLTQIAARWPGQVVSIGPVKPEVRAAYEAIKGLVRVPPVHNLDLPKYLRSFDVCIQPHLQLEVRHRADPLKIVEYLAAGKPIVSTRLRNLEPLRNVIDLVDGHSDFLAAVERNLATPDAGLVNERIALARGRSWDSLFEKICSKLSTVG